MKDCVRGMAGSLYDTVFRSSPIGSYLLSPSADPVILDVNDAFLAAASRTREELVGARLFEAFGSDPDDPSDTAVDALRASIVQAIDTGAPAQLPAQRYPIPVRAADGSIVFEERFWNAVNTPIYDEDGRLACVLHHTVDVTRQLRAEEQLRESAQRLRLATDAAKLGIWVWDIAAGTSIWENERLYEMFGVPARTGAIDTDRFVRDFIHPGDLDRYRQAIEHTLASGERFHFIGRFIRQPDGALRWFEMTGLLHRAADGSPSRIIGTAADVTDRREAEEAVRHASLHDPLTGLPNRAMLFEYANRLLPHNRRTGQRAAVLFIDLDRFKPINDTHGHEIGDIVLRQVAARLSCCLRAEDIVIRLGGDEFVILLEDIPDAATAVEVTRLIVDRINAPYTVGELTLSLSTSIGIAMYPDDGEDIDTLISHADMAMYQAKQAGRDNWQFYSAACSASTRMQLMIEERLQSVLRAGGFRLYYQPVFDVASGRVVSAEALLRWPHGEIGPDRFVPVAEASGMINPIGRWLLQEAARQHKRWREKGLPAIPISVNVSAVEFRNPHFAGGFERTMADQGVGADALQIEVTETAVMSDVRHAIEVLARLRGLGVKILLDDFGTGQSSLAYLARLPLDKVKIDKSFVAPLDGDVAGRAIINAMIALGNTLELEVVAEGVETQSVLDYVRHHGCRQVQGFHVGRPMPGDAFEAWFRRQAGAAGAH